MEIELPIFGKIKLNKEESWKYKYDVRKRKYNFIGIPIDLDVNFEEVGEQKILKVSSALKDLPKIHGIGKKALQKNFKSGLVVDEYIEEWNEDIFLQVFDDRGFQDFIKKTDCNKSIEERLFSLIRIVRIGIYAESENSFITMDFAFGYDDKGKHGFREDMLVVTLNPALEATDIWTEG